MEKPVFDFKRHQNLSKNRKMLVRFIIYSIVISVLVYLILKNEDGKTKHIYEGDIEAIDVKIDEVQTE